MPATNVRSQWKSGSLAFQDASGNEVVRIASDGVYVKQPAPTAETGVATITAADILTKIVTISHTTGATVALTGFNWCQHVVSVVGCCGRGTCRTSHLPAANMCRLDALVGEGYTVPGSGCLMVSPSCTCKGGVQQGRKESTQQQAAKQKTDQMPTSALVTLPSAVPTCSCDFQSLTTSYQTSSRPALKARSTPSILTCALVTLPTNTPGG